MWNRCSSHSLVSVSSNMSWLCFNKKGHWNIKLGDLKSSFEAWQWMFYSPLLLCHKDKRRSDYKMQLCSSPYSTQKVLLSRGDLYSQETWLASHRKCEQLLRHEALLLWMERCLLVTCSHLGGFRKVEYWEVQWCGSYGWLLWGRSFV